jgi:hypothetical protein
MRTVVGVLEEPYSAKPAQLSSQRLHRMDTVPAYVDWRVCTATPLSGILSTFLPTPSLALPVTLGPLGLCVPEPTTYLSFFVQLTTDPCIFDPHFLSDFWVRTHDCIGQSLSFFYDKFLSNCQNKEQETKFGQLPVIDLSLSQLSQNIPSKTGTK